MTRNRFVGRDALPAGIVRCANDVEHRMVLADSGLLVVFESRAISWPDKDRIEPFYVARHDFERDGPERGTPVEVLDHLADPEWNHFVWVLFEFAHGDELRFTIRYAHELQHYRQVSDPQSLHDAREFLRQLKRSGFVPTIRTENDPREFDADRVSLCVSREIHGQEKLSRYIEAESCDSRIGNFYQRLLTLESRWEEYVSGRV